LENYFEKGGMIQERSSRYKKCFITTKIEAGGSTAPTTLPTPPNTASLIGAIELSEKNNLLATTGF
jgi:hypothetical protein